MSRSKQLFALLAVGVTPPALALATNVCAQTILSVLIASVISFLGYRWTCYLIPRLAPRHVKAGLSGRDINKKGTEAGEKPVPESMGLATGVVTLVCLALVHVVHKLRLVPRACSWLGWQRSEPDATDPWNDDFPAALSSIAFMLMLGFVDDVLDLPWRVKLVMPVVASLPLLAAYSGATAIGIPKPLVEWLQLTQTYVELGPLYYVYMVALVVFCTNSINILAGVNGLEAGQTFLVGCAILTHNLLQLARSPDGSVAASHLFSSYTMLPLVATTFALLRSNWYPSAVFVGDTYTYFAGMTIAVAGILGHFSETLLVFLVPQVFNFVYSIPQLAGWVHCPRHRLPAYNTKTGLLHATPNWNLVNLMLHLGGPCTELWLCVRILALQVVVCVVGVAAHLLLKGTWK